MCGDNTELFDKPNLKKLYLVNKLNIFFHYFFSFLYFGGVFLNFDGATGSWAVGGVLIPF